MGSLWIGERVRLRAVEADDWAAFAEFDLDTDDMRSVDRVYPPRSADASRRWALDQAAKEPSTEEFLLAVTTMADGTVVGSVSTSDVEPRPGRFGYGVAIGAAHKRRGYATEAVRLLLGYMFGECRLHKCEVRVVASNEPSLALHRALGFRVEGTLRDHEFSAGAFHDVVLLGMTAPEWAERHRRTGGWTGV